MNKLYIVGIGPGNRGGMSFDAYNALNSSEIIVGYTKYIELIKAIFPNKKKFSTPMTREADRCKKAYEMAKEGKNVSVICSGDSGVYGMASLIYEIADAPELVEIVCLPGITAASSGAAILGAPIGHDFAVISLSDMLTPWDTIVNRLIAAAKGDFCICLYNPSSKRRCDFLEKACDILLQYLPENRPCGIAQNIGRDGENSKVLKLSKLRNTPVDMFTTVFIGNSQSKNIDGKLVTPRGYKNV